MLPIYATALAIGGALLLASLVLGHHGADHAGGLHLHHGGMGHHDTDVGFLANFLSLRFWTFALAFFGLTGVVFEKLVPLPDGRSVLGVAVAMGGTIGFLAAWIVNKLRSSNVTSTPTEIGYIGLEGEVLLDVTQEEPGRIRISARGSLIDLPARTNGPRFEKGARAVIMDMADGVARIGLLGGPSPAAPAPPPPAPPES